MSYFVFGILSGVYCFLVFLINFFVFYIWYFGCGFDICIKCTHLLFGVLPRGSGVHCVQGGQGSGQEEALHQLSWPLL